MSYLKSTSNLMNQLDSIEYYFSTPHDPLTDLILTYQSLALPSIEHLERKSINIGMITVVIRKLRQREICIPTPTVIQYTWPKHIFQGLYSPLTLSVSLRVEVVLKCRRVPNPS